MSNKVTKNSKGVPCFSPFSTRGEKVFIIRPGRIATKPRSRKRGVFMRTGMKTYFTCPHCKGMNVTLMAPDNRHRDSVMCKKCDRHLFCMYRTVVPKYCEYF